jgi:hypothetical protein
MDLRKIVEEVEHRKREEYALYAPQQPKAPPARASGATSSILHSVRDRMLRENPAADVAAITQVIEPNRAVEHESAPESAVVAIAREAARTSAHEKPMEPRHARMKDDFLARYLLMSEEFERRFGVKGWTELVRKRSSAGLRH